MYYVDKGSFHTFYYKLGESSANVMEERRGNKQEVIGYITEIIPLPLMSVEHISKNCEKIKEDEWNRVKKQATAFLKQF